MVENAATVGGRLKQAREAAGASCRQLAAKLGVVHSAVYHWESGRRSLALDTAKRIARLFGVSIRWLLCLSADGGPGAFPPSTFRKSRGGRPRLPRRGGDGRYCPPPMPDPDGPDFDDPQWGSPTETNTAFLVLDGNGLRLEAGESAA